MDEFDLLGLVSKRYSAKIQKDEVLIESCVYCGNDRWNLELQVEYGVFHCWACKAAGTLRSFLAEWCNVVTHIPVTYSGSKISYEVPKDHLDIETEPVEGIGSARAYLERRGLTLSEMMAHDIRFCREPEYANRIMLPAREYYTQRLFGYVGRAYLSGQKPKYMATFRSPMVAGLRNHQSSVHIVVEGLLDVYAVHRAGYHGAAVLGGAVGDVLLDGWGARIPQDHTIVVLLDGDAQEKAERIKWRLMGVHQRVVIYALPLHMDPAMLLEPAVRALVDTAMRQGGLV